MIMEKHFLIYIYIYNTLEQKNVNILKCLFIIYVNKYYSLYINTVYTTMISMILKNNITNLHQETLKKVIATNILLK